MPKVSIIVPNYNHERFLEKRLRSILGQSFQSWELIFIDDASTDKSLDVFRNISSDLRIKPPIVSKTRSGNIFQQWQKGIEMSIGEYVWIAESDDYADSSFLETAVKALDLHRSAGVVCAASYLINECGEITGVIKAKCEDGVAMNGPEICRRELIFANNMPNASAVVFRKSVYDALSFEYGHQRFILSHDWFLWVRLLSVSDLVYIKEPLNFFRRHGNAASDVLGKTEQGVYEKALILQHITRHMDINKTMLRASIRQLTDEWMMRILKYGKFFDRNKDIYYLAHSMYPGTGLLLCESFFRFYMKKISQKYHMIIKYFTKSENKKVNLIKI